MVRTSLLSLLLVSFLATACGPAPVPVERKAEASPAHPGPDVPDAGTLPPGHPPLDGVGGGGAAAPPPEGRFAGVVRLRGDLAQRADGFVMVSVKPEGIRMPSYSRKYALADAEPEAAGERLLHFELDSRHRMGGLVPGGLVLEARFDPDGYVESKEGVVIETVETSAGDTSAEIILGSGS